MLASLITALFATAAVSSSETQLSFGQGENEGTVVVSANGIVAKDGGALLVQLRDIKVADQPADPSTIPYATYRVCLVRGKPETGWERIGCSDPVSIRVMVDSERPVSLPNRKFTIPSAGDIPLDQCWLVLEMTSKPMQGRTYSAFSHSQRSIFTAWNSD